MLVEAGVSRSVRWQIRLVVELGDDDRLVHVALHEVDQHFAADARDEGSAPGLRPPLEALSGVSTSVPGSCKPPEMVRRTWSRECYCC